MVLRYETYLILHRYALGVALVAPALFHLLPARRGGDKAPLPRAATDAHVRAYVTIALIVAPFVPASNALFPVGTFIAERLLYLPSAGAVMLLGGAVEGWKRGHVAGRWRRAVTGTGCTQRFFPIAPLVPASGGATARI